jgi:hypothetical protein
MKCIIDEELRVDYSNRLEGGDPDLKDLILDCLLQRDPSRRLTVGELKKHEFFTGLDWEDAGALKLKPPLIPVIESFDDMRNIDKRFLRESI